MDEKAPIIWPEGRRPIGVCLTPPPRPARRPASSQLLSNLEDLRHLAPWLEDEGRELPDLLETLFRSVGPSEGVDPTWYIDESWAFRLPESLVACLPPEPRASVAFLAGHQAPGRLVPDTALEAAKALWGQLRPMACASELGRRLLRLESQALLELLYALGSDLAGAVLRHVPDRLAATFCAALPLVWARRTWSARGAPSWHLESRQLTALKEALAAGGRRDVLPKLGLVVLASGLAEYPEDLRVLCQKLPRHLCDTARGEPILPAEQARAAISYMLPAPPPPSPGSP